MATSSATRGAGVEQGLDEHDVGTAASLPDGLVPAAELVFGGDVGQLLGGALHLDVEFGSEVAEDVFEVGVVGPLGPEVLGELAGFLPGGRSPRDGRFGHAAAGVRSRRRSMSRVKRP